MSNTYQYSLINTVTNKIIKRASFTKKEATTLNYALSMNGSVNKWILNSTLLSRFAEYKA